MDIYRGVLRQQTGRGILGNMMGLFSRTLVPMLKTEAKKLGPKILKTGVGVLSDISTRKRTFKQAAQKRGKALINEMINTPSPKRPRQSKTGSKRKKSPLKAKKRKTVSKKQQQREKDIFD